MYTIKTTSCVLLNILFDIFKDKILLAVYFVLTLYLLPWTFLTKTMHFNFFFPNLNIFYFLSNNFFRKFIVASFFSF